jgi:hypothetical protein
MVDRGLNICVTGDLGYLLDMVDSDPIVISVTLDVNPMSTNDCITKRGLLLLTLADGTVYYQTCFYCANLVKTIVSLAAVLASSNVFISWQQVRYKDPTIPRTLRFTSKDGLVSMEFTLHCHDDLYYCASDVYMVDPNPVHVQCHWAAMTLPATGQARWSQFTPTTHAWQVESKVWAL